MANNKVYKSLTQVEHVLLRPGMYVGSTTKSTRSDFLWRDDKFVWESDVLHVEGLVKLVNEAIDNAVDNSKVSFNPTTRVVVQIRDGRVCVSNDGAHIPVRTIDGGNDLIPTVIFGKCRSGSNFDDNNREGAGLNGLGIKLANIFSTEFNVICRDPPAKKTFTGKWTNNMRSVTTDVANGNPLPQGITTSVDFKPDPKFFSGVTPEQIIPWIHTRLVQVAHTTPKLRLFFNGQQVKGGNFKSFMKLFGSTHTFYDKPTDNFEYGVGVSTTGEYCHSSFVNSLRTTADDSTHTRLVYRSVVEAVKEFLTKKHKGASVVTGTVATKLHLFVNCHVPSPDFASQTKEKLTSAMPRSVKLDTGRILGVLKKSGVMAALEEALLAKSIKDMSKAMDGSKRSKVVVDKYDGAQNAGTAKSHECTLYVVEGDSAKTMFTIGASVIGRSTNGVFPIRGKLLNVRGASPPKLKGNEEIKNLMKILGLRMDCKYETDAEYRTLRYGKLCIMTDADVDGAHINGLLVNFIANFWPNLITKHGFITRFVTPIIKAIKRGSPPVFFFNDAEFKAWERSNNTAPYQLIHLKGLGTSERPDTVNYFKTTGQHLKAMEATTNTLTYTDNVFNPKLSNWRKTWLTTRGVDDVRSLDYKQPKFKIDDFYDSELYQFSQSDIVRSIPSVVDGLKKSQRQVLCGALHHFEKSSNKQYKVAQLAGIVAAHTKYAHGEVSLQDCITGMAQRFPGSNNLTILDDKGAFGSRMLNGKDSASARYIYTALTDDARKLFPREDDVVLDYRTEEGQVVEPKFYVPTLPLLLINGATGIATGYSTELPCFNPADIITIIKLRLQGKPASEPMPWYRGYSTNSLTQDTPSRWIFQGAWSKTGPQEVAITELPIGYSIDGYKSSVLGPLQEKDLIQDVLVDHRDENNPRFVVKFRGGIPPDTTNFLKLTKTMTKNCLNFLDRNGVIKTYRSVVAVVDDWLDVRLQYTEKRRQSMIATANDKLLDINWRLKFLQAVITKSIRVMRVKRAEVVSQMVAHGIPSEYHQPFLQIPIVSITEERMVELERSYQSTVATITFLKNTNKMEMYEKDLAKWGGPGTPTKKRPASSSSSSSTAAKKPKVISLM
jgi:DNA topoisomerase II